MGKYIRLISLRTLNTSKILSFAFETEKDKREGKEKEADGYTNEARMKLRKRKIGHLKVEFSVSLLLHLVFCTLP